MINYNCYTPVVTASDLHRSRCGYDSIHSRLNAAKCIHSECTPFLCRFRERALLHANQAHRGSHPAGACGCRAAVERLLHDGRSRAGPSGRRPRHLSFRTGKHDLSAVTFRQEMKMDKDRVEGAAKQAKGAVKEAWGKATGDAKTQAEGKADKAEGRVQNAVGGMKDAAREARDKVTGKE